MQNDVPLGLAVWLVSDSYDYVLKENYLSATSLMRPVRATVLGSRVPSTDQKSDILDLVPSRIGTAIHDSVEKAWSGNLVPKLLALGYPEKFAHSVKVNPDTPEGCFPVYIEQRAFKTIDGWEIGGKFDLVIDGVVQDVKSTSTYSWTSASKEDDYILQMSIYRWLNPDKITADYGVINYVFTDWKAHQALNDKDYPQSRVIGKQLPLMSIQDTEQWVRSRLNQITKYQSALQEKLPECTDKELWREAPKFKYYSDPSKTTGRSTKNFDSLAEASAYRASKGVGVVLTVAGEPRRCLYCSAAPICEQRKRILPDV